MEGEAGAASNFLSDVEQIQIAPHQQDRWLWLGDSCGEYRVSSAYYSMCEDLNDQNDDDDVLFSKLWKTNIPSKVAHFLWRLIRDGFTYQM